MASDINEDLIKKSLNLCPGTDTYEILSSAFQGDEFMISKIKDFFDGYYGGNSYWPQLIKYDTHVFDDVGKEYYSKIRSILSSIEISKDCVTTNLLYRKFFNTEEERLKFKRIRGPVLMRYLESEKFPHKILLIGDHHYKSSSICRDSIDSYQFLDMYTKYSPNYIDIFLESPYYKGERKEEELKDSYLSDTMHHFKECLHSKICETPTTRVHYTDIRFYSSGILEELNNNFSELLYYAEVVNKMLHDLNLSDEDESLLLESITVVYNYLENIREQMLMIFNNDIRDTFPELYKLVIKQIENIPSDFIKKKLLKYFDRELNRHLNINRLTSHKDIVFAKEYLDEVDLDDMADMNNLNRYIEMFEGIYMTIEGIVSIPFIDFYTLGRIFRKYNQVSNYYSDPAYNIVLYYGSGHIKNMKKILYKLKFDWSFTAEPDHVSGPRQCVDIKNKIFFQ